MTSKRSIRSAVVGIAVGALVLAPALVARAFPTYAETYPNYSGCYATTSATAGYSGQEWVEAATYDYNLCTEVVFAKACAFLNPGTVCTGWDSDGYLAYQYQYADDYYYGYAQGQVYMGSVLTTVAVHP